MSSVGGPTDLSDEADAVHAAQMMLREICGPHAATPGYACPPVPCADNVRHLLCGWFGLAVCARTGGRAVVSVREAIVSLLRRGHGRTRSAIGSRRFGASAKDGGAIRWRSGRCSVHAHVRAVLGVV